MQTTKSNQHAPDKLLHNVLLLVAIIIAPVILILQQGIVPIFKKLSNDGNPSIFLALHLPEQWQWYGIVGMIMLGLVILALAVKGYRRAASKKV